MGKITIENIINETIKGNVSAEKELYLTYKRKINHFLINKYGSENEYSDDVSEILIKIFTNLKKFDQTKSKFDTWVYNIAKNYMIDKSKKKKPQHVSFSSNTINSFDFDDDSIKYGIPEPASYLSSPHDILETSDSLNFISNQLGVENYSMLTMKYMDGYSYDEIALEFKSSESYISNRVNYSKTKIKKGEN